MRHGCVGCLTQMLQLLGPPLAESEGQPASEKNSPATNERLVEEMAGSMESKQCVRVCARVCLFLYAKMAGSMESK